VGVDVAVAVGGFVGVAEIVGMTVDVGVAVAPVGVDVGVFVAVDVAVGRFVGVAVPPPLQAPLSTQSAATAGGSQPTRDVCACWQV
jgi:hypothetical protein